MVGGGERRGDCRARLGGRREGGGACVAGEGAAVGLTCPSKARLLQLKLTSGVAGSPFPRACLKQRMRGRRLRV
jgi:hypothetical protein